MTRFLELSILSIFGTLLFFPNFTTISIILWVIFCIIYIIQSKSRFKLNSALMIMPLLYLVYLFGLLYTKDFSYATKDLFSKFPLVVFPVLFSFGLQLNLKNIAKGFIILCIISGLVSILESLILLKLYPPLNYQALIGSKLGFKVHTTYLSWYYITAILFVFNFWMNKQILFGKIKDILIVLFFIPFIFFLLSLSNLILLFIILFVFVFLFTLKYKGVKTSLLCLSLSMFLISFSYFIPYVKQEVNNGFTEIKSSIYDANYKLKNKDKTSSFKARISLWSVAYELIKEKPMGFGTGDGKNTFVEKCKSYDLIVGQKKFNPHNQYFQTTLAIGVIGLIILLLSFVIQFLFAIKYKNFLLLTLMIGIIIHSLFESMLELQSGIVFFCLFSSLFINISLIKKH